jgi:plastocyanin/mono/diheme cytochrome c family protein
MTDTPGRRPEERLPAPRPEPTVPAPTERFSSPPSARKFELTPERAAGIVRQSANARWVGFLAVTIVALFVIGYYFYELGLPGGLSKPRLVAEEEAQQITQVERGYNVYQANCARCHGVNGEGGVGPTLHRQDKLFKHLNEDYLNNVMVVGGRYVCGNPDSIMPVWSDAGHPPGPLNYRQIQELIAFIRSDASKEYEVLDPALAEPVHNPDGSVKTFHGWVDPNYKPQPNATPYPDCWTQEFAAPAGSAAPSGSPAGSSAPKGQPSATGSPSGSIPGSAAPSGAVSPSAGATTVKLAAQGIKFDQASLQVPAGQAFQLEFANNDPSTPHNVEIQGANKAVVFKGQIVNGVATTTYQVPSIPAGTYTFLCTVHPTMTGTLTAS